MEALVDEVIAAVLAGRARIEVVEARPLSAKVLGQLTFSNGGPLPPSLRRWLGFDAGWLARDFGLSRRVRRRLPVQTIAKAVDEAGLGGGGWGSTVGTLRAAGIDAAVWPLDCGSDSMRVLYVGARDETGEYPVLTIDVGDTPQVEVLHTSWAEWLAAEAGVGEQRPPVGGVNLGGASVVELIGEQWQGSHDGETLWSGTCPVAEDRPQRERKPARSATKLPKKPAPKLPTKRLGAALVEAIKTGDDARADELQQQLTAGQGQRTKWKNEALHAAFDNHDVRRLGALLELGANPNAEGKWGRPLPLAARHGEVRLMELSAPSPVRGFGSPRRRPRAHCSTICSSPGRRCSGNCRLSPTDARPGRSSPRARPIAP